MKKKLTLTSDRQPLVDLKVTEIIELSGRDQVRFAKALINPPKPNARLRRAAKRYMAWLKEQ